MTQPIGPGDWVECVATGGDEWLDEPIPYGPGRHYEEGCVYLVAEVGSDEDFDWLHCDGMVRPLDGTGWDVNAFRPIYRPRENAFSHLLEVTPAEAERIDA